MARVNLQVRNIMNLGLWDKVCEYKGWNPWILNEGRISEDEWVEFDDTFEKLDESENNKYFLLKEVVSGKWLLYEKDSTFYNHDDQDLLVATIEDEGYAKMICDLLNKQISI